MPILTVTDADALFISLGARSVDEVEVIMSVVNMPEMETIWNIPHREFF